MYGITETTVYSTYHRITPGRPGAGGAARSAGRCPACGCTCSTQTATPVPVGVPGELYLGGARGGPRLPRPPELTARRFVPDPYGPPGAGCTAPATWPAGCPTAAWSSSAALDDQVKVRGYRIEPGEIEAALRRAPGVAEAVVVLRADDPATAADRVRGAGDGRRGGRPRCAPRWRAPCRSTWSRRRSWCWTSCRCTNSGKLDRRALPAPGATPALAGTFVAPGRAAGGALAGIWADVLGLPAVGVSDGFFDLGGDSITALGAGRHDARGRAGRDGARTSSGTRPSGRSARCWRAGTRRSRPTAPSSPSSWSPPPTCRCCRPGWATRTRCRGCSSGCCWRCWRTTARTTTTTSSRS